MAIRSNLIGIGFNPFQSRVLTGENSSGLTATGSSVTDAYKISSVVNEFTTVASSTGAVLPPMEPSDAIFVYNAGANTLSIYPRTGEAINNGSTDAAYSLAANKGVMIVKRSNTKYMAILTA